MIINFINERKKTISRLNKSKMTKNNIIKAINNLREKNEYTKICQKYLNRITRLELCEYLAIQISESYFNKRWLT